MKTRQYRDKSTKNKSKSFRDTSSIIKRHSKSKKSRKKGITLTREDIYHPDNPNFDRFETSYYIKNLIEHNASSKNMLDYLDLLTRNGINMDSNLHRLFNKEDLEKLASVVPRDYTSRNRLLKKIDASLTLEVNDRLNASHRREVRSPIVGHTGRAAGIKNKTHKRKSRKGRKSRRRKV